MTSSGGAPTTTRRPTARSARTDSSVVSSNESGYRLSTSGSPLSGLNSGTIFHCAAPLEVVARVLHPNDRNLLRASPFDHAADVRDRRVPLVRLAQDAGLHVDHQQRVSDGSGVSSWLALPLAELGQAIDWRGPVQAATAASCAS